MMENKDFKCVVWDLDGTLWDGVLLEDDTVQLRSGIKNIIQTLDRRGILQSIASKNDYDAAMQKIRDFGLNEYFLCPEPALQIHLTFSFSNNQQSPGTHEALCWQY